MEHTNEDQERVISGQQCQTLENLVTRSRDASSAYRYASAIALNPQHRELLLALAKRRSELVDALWKPLKRERGAASNNGSTLGALRRGRRWLVSLLDGAHDADLFRDCATAEARVLRLYTRALRRNWPNEIRSVLEEQAGEVKSNYEQMRQMRATN